MPLATPSAPGEKCSSLVEQASEDQQQRGDNGGGGQHLAQDAALGGFRHVRGRVQERHQRDLGPDPDQEQQERVDDEGGIQRFEFFHRAPSSVLTIRAGAGCG